MVVCPHTGITVPECSCSACLLEQMRRHNPALQQAQQQPQAQGPQGAVGSDDARPAFNRAA